MDDVLHRDVELRLLSGALRGSHLPQSILLHGQPGSGKSLLLKRVWEITECDAVNINLLECSHSVRSLFEEIVRCVTSKLDLASDGDPEARIQPPRCENGNKFVLIMKELLTDAMNGEDDRVALLFDRAEKLRAIPSVLPIFLKCQEFIHPSLCCVFVTHLPWCKFNTSTGLCPEMEVGLPSYSKAELLDILCLCCPKKYSEETFRHFCGLLLNMYFFACRDVRELQHLIKTYFPIYIRPVDSGEVQEKDVQRLWRLVQPAITNSFSSVYSRSIQATESQLAARPSNGTSYSMTQGSSQRFDTYSYQKGSCREVLELPLYSKYLLIAGFLASHNPPKTDRRFFIKGHGKIKRSGRTIQRARAQDVYDINGPKSFVLERLLAIFCAIVDEAMKSYAEILIQVRSLAALGLFAEVASVGSLETPKYKCTINKDLAKLISVNIDFDLEAHMFMEV